MERQQDARQAEFALSFLRGIDILPGDALPPERFGVIEQYRVVAPSRGAILLRPGQAGRCGERGHAPPPASWMFTATKSKCCVPGRRGDRSSASSDLPVVASGSWAVELRDPRLSE